MIKDNDLFSLEQYGKTKRRKWRLHSAMASALVDTCLGHFVAPYTHLFFKTQTVLSYVIEIESYILLFFCT